nr:IS3 family transposase [Gordonia insulae]
MPRQYPPEFRQKSVRMLETALEADAELSEFEAIRQVAAKQQVAEETLRRWRRKAQIDAGQRAGTSSEEHAEIRRLKKEVAELRRTNELLKSASAFFRLGARPDHDEMIAFIDKFRDQFGVEFICRTLRAAGVVFLTSRGYRAAKSRAASARSIRDTELVAVVKQVHSDNYAVYGVKKVHAELRRKGHVVGREQTRRLMRCAGVRGVQRSKKVFTTRADPAAAVPEDRVKRTFVATQPNQLWVVDITYVRTWQGFAYVAFVTDVCTRKIMGWHVASSMRTEDLPLPAFDHAVWQANTDLSGLTHHSDHGSQYLSLAYTDRLIELGITPSVGTVGDSYDNALAESVNSAYKTELIRQRGPWRTVEQVELATLEYVWWYNNQRLHEALGYVPPAEYEATLTGASHPSEPAVPALATT